MFITHEFMEGLTSNGHIWSRHMMLIYANLWNVRLVNNFYEIVEQCHD